MTSLSDALSKCYTIERNIWMMAKMTIHAESPKEVHVCER